MDSGKILLCNVSKGKLGEERSFFFGVLLVSLIQLASYRRVAQPEKERQDFFLYVDEFQNFATHAFGKLLSEARKYHVYATLSHQTISQIEETALVKIILDNVGTMICLRTGPADEKEILPFLSPEVEPGDVINLAPHHFFMKVTNEDSEDAFSGVTVPLNLAGDKKIADWIIENTKKKYGTPRAEVEKKLDLLFGVQEKNTSSTTPKPAGEKNKPKDTQEDEGMG